MDTEIIPSIYKKYQEEIYNPTSNEMEVTVEQLKKELKLLKGDEAILGRLIITGKLIGKTYDKLRQ